MMKANTVPSIIALAISILITYGVFAFWRGEQLSQLHYATTSFAFILSAITLTCAVGINFETNRITTIIRTVSIVFFFIGLVVLILIMLLSNSLPVLILGMGILILIFILIIYGISKSGQ